MFLIVISTSIFFKFCCTSCCACSRDLLPAVVDMVNASRTPSLARTPSAPTFQPASSSSAAAFFRIEAGILQVLVVGPVVRRQVAQRRDGTP